MLMTVRSTFWRGTRPQRRIMFCAGLALLSIAVPAWPCQSGGNLVLECGFPDASFTPPWTVEVGTCSHSTSASNTPFSLQCDSVDNTTNNVVRIIQCLSATDADYAYGADASLVANNTVPTCTVEVSDFTGALCSTNVNSASTPLVPASAPTYSQSSPATYNTDANTVSVQVMIRCSAPTGAGEAFTIRFDDVFVGVGLTPVELQEFSVE